MNKKTYSLILSILLSAFALFAISAQEGFAQSYSLTVINTGAGDGTITSRPSGINCGATCTGTFAKGKKVTLKAKPNSDSSFAGWAGGGCTSIDPCSIIMDSDVTVTATFDQKTPEISLSTDKLEFDVLKPGKKVKQTLVISNIGTGNLIVTVSGIEGTDFSISGKSTFVIKPGKTYKLKVNYAPPASETVATDGQTTEEPVSGTEGVDIEGDMEEDLETSAGETLLAASGAVKGKMKLETNDPKHPQVDVDLVELAPLTRDKKDFIKVPTWQLDITWSANEAYEDGDWSAKVEMTATATYILKQSDRHLDTGWGSWHVVSVQSWNMSYSGFIDSKPPGWRTDYSAGNQLLGAEAADFQVGSFYNPSGYELHAILDPTLNSTGVPGYPLVSLLTDDFTQSAPLGFCMGPLPGTGLTIHGSLVVPLPVPPFDGGTIPYARVGIQFVLQPYRK